MCTFIEYVDPGGFEHTLLGFIVKETQINLKLIHPSGGESRLASTASNLENFMDKKINTQSQIDE